jgi:hypothetical protein
VKFDLSPKQKRAWHHWMPQKRVVERDIISRLVGCLRMKKETKYVTFQHKTSRFDQILESEILVLCDSVLQELSTNIFDIIIQ